MEKHVVENGTMFLVANKQFHIKENDISDGYHTFGELYDHRIVLFLALLSSGFFKNAVVNENHYPDWDCIFAYTKEGEQISYHVPVSYRPFYETLERRPDEWDGHKSSDVLERLKKAIIIK